MGETGHSPFLLGIHSSRVHSPRPGSSSSPRVPPQNPRSLSRSGWVSQLNSIDLVFRHNYFRDIKHAAALSLDSGKTCARIIFLNNTVEWPTSGDPVGFSFGGAGSYTNIIARGNLMRRMDGQAASGTEVGIKIEDGTNWTNAVIDQNVIEVGTELNNAITRRSFSSITPPITTITTFNNLKPNGTFLPSYDRSSQTHDQELTTDVEADILGL